MDSIVERVRQFLLRVRAPRPGERILLSLSAGKDSMCMLDVMHALRKEFGFVLESFHLNHMTRGEDSDGDERFVIRRCADYGVECTVERRDFFPEGGQKGSFEERARTVRYALLEKTATEKGCTLAATAHNLDDQAETVLMRVFTGTGVHGLSGIAPVRGPFVRPLLCLRADEILQYLMDRGLSFREDSSNSDLRYTRNFIRNRVIPLIRERFPMAPGAINSLSQNSSDTMRLLGELMEKQFGDFILFGDEETVIEAQRFGRNDLALGECIARTLRDFCGSYVHKTLIEEIIKKYRSKKPRCLLHEGTDVVIEKSQGPEGGRIIMTRNACRKCNIGPYEYSITDISSDIRAVEIEELGMRFYYSLVGRDYYHEFRSDPRCSFMSLNGTDPGFVIRNRRAGDRIRTESGSKKIKDFFIEKKLDSMAKSRISLIIVGTSIAAIIPGTQADMPPRIAHPFKITDSSQKILALRW